jgi:hypothetical protein
LTFGSESGVLEKPHREKEFHFIKKKGIGGNVA